MLAKRQFTPRRMTDLVDDRNKLPTHRVWSTDETGRQGTDVHITAWHTRLEAGMEGVGPWKTGIDRKLPGTDVSPVSGQLNLSRVSSHKKFQNSPVNKYGVLGISTILWVLTRNPQLAG